ncbi:MAG: heavy-metal-associated domain-containing protein [Oscillospiraceae bacterium]|nr:heavy-metal-associated domain-containing protein [Oscillospiraceae bacterium]
MEFKISVQDMHCEHCVKRIDTALEEAGLSYDISLEDKTVSITGCEKCLEKAVSAIEDLGFTPEV